MQEHGWHIGAANYFVPGDVTYNWLNSNLKVPWVCARKVISGPNAYSFPLPTDATKAATPSCRYACPQAHPLRNGLLVANHANGFTFPVEYASGLMLKTGL